jgi:D-alanyl-D-alanine carboxypeptidase
MMEAFISATGNRSVAIISAFRSRENQERILNDYISRMGRREALRWAALPGHSEHHTGLAFDFGVMTGNNRSTFTGTGNTAWFRRNSYNYGFILRYQQHKTEITQTAYEPWHYRFVGLPHSVIMARNDWCLEEYIELLRNYTFEEPFTFELGDILYEIYFTTSTQVPLPINSEFEISGNNIDGFIVTVNRLEFDPDVIIDVSV